jgi:hypothetical protein
VRHSEGAGPHVSVVSVMEWGWKGKGKGGCMVCDAVLLPRRNFAADLHTPSHETAAIGTA